LVISAIVLIVPLACVRWRSNLQYAAPATEEQAVRAIELVKDWGTWITGIATGAIGVTGLLLKGRTNARPFALAAVSFLGLSIVLNTWLLAILPSLVLRLSATPTRDIYEMHLFDTVYAQGEESIRVGLVYDITHLYFVAGIASFAVAFLRNLEDPAVLKPDAVRKETTT